MDILLTGYTGSKNISKIYKNNGDRSFNDSGISLIGVRSSSAVWGDYDNDGDLDILLTGYNGSSYISKIYKNNEGGSFSDSGISLTEVLRGSIAWGDYDNDGDLDILLTGYNGSSYISKIYKNNGDGSFSDSGISLTGVQYSSVAWGDYNNDGYLDILLTGYTGSSYISKIYKNNGDGTFSVTEIPLIQIANGSATWCDYDNDSDLDILLTGYNGYSTISQIYKNNLLVPNNKPNTSTDLSSSQVNSSTVKLSWQNNEDKESGFALSYNIRVGSYPGGSDIVNPMADVSNGFRKIVERGKGIRSYWWYLKYLPAGTYYWSVQAIDNSFAGSEFSNEASFTVTQDMYSNFQEKTDLGTGISYSNGDWGDYDNDGDLDLIIMGNSSTGEITEIFKNDNNSFVESGFNIDGVYDGDVKWGDFNNDDYLDFVITGRANTGVVSKIYTNNQDGTFTDVINLDALVYSCAVWGDYNNDGYLDLFMAGYSTSEGQSVAKIYKNNADGTFESISNTIPGIRYASAAWGDCDSDGDLDLLFSGLSSSGRITQIYKNNNGVFTNSSISLPGLSKGSVAWGNINNSGRLDILLTGISTSGEYKTYIYSYNGVIDDYYDFSPAEFEDVAYSSSCLGDINNDGALDVIFTGESFSTASPVTKIYLNLNLNEFQFIEDTRHSLEDIWKGCCTLGDYDNDGDLDLFISGSTPSGRIAKIYESNYNTPNSIPSDPSNLSQSIEDTDVNLTWNSASDNETPSDGITYNLRIGTTPGGNEIITPMADVSNGFRKINGLGNTNHNTSWTIKDLQQGQRYYWSVQAIDNCFAGSAFSAEETFLYGVSPDEEPGYALEFDGVDDYVNCGNNSILNIEDKITIEAWIYYQGGESFPRIIEKYPAPSIYINESNNLLGWYGEIGGSVEDFTFSNTEISQNEWTHIAVTYDGSNVKAYINGNCKASVSYTGTLTTTSDDLILGNNIATDRSFLGKIDEIRIWNSARTETEIRENIHKTLEGNESGLIGYWQLNDGTGSATAVELSGESNGTLTNMEPNSDWVISTVPTGGGVCNSCTGFTNGTKNFGNLTLTTTNEFDNEVDLVFNEIERSPNTNSGVSSNVLNKYYVMNVYGTPGSFSTDLTFTLPEGYISSDDQSSPANLKLYKRESTSYGEWTEITSATEATSTTVTFEGISSFSQFIIGSETSALPVELVSFTASVVDSTVKLNWQTATEVNNYGFQVQRNTPLEGGMSETSGVWEDIGFVNGNGNNNSPKSYSYTDTPVGGTTFKYRLKQIDFDGAYEYSDAVEVTLGAITEYSLEQNYPNPFNPTTTIKYRIPDDRNVELKVYDVLGKEVMTLVNETQQSGVYTVEFNASELASGVYIYRLRAEDYVSVKKLILIK